MSDPLLPSRVCTVLATHRLGARLFYYPETDSTNDVASALARAGEPAGTVVVTDYQRRGRGRREHQWESPRGRDLLFSVLFRPAGEVRAALATSLVVSAAASVALGKLLGVDAGVKWPNDIMVGGGKLGGVLAEASSGAGGADFVVVGLGINVNSGPADWAPDVAGRATSCAELVGESVDRAAILADVLASVETYTDRLARDGFAPLVPWYEERMVARDRDVVVVCGDERAPGRVLGVDPDGALRVRIGHDASVRTLYSESIELP